MPVHVLPDGATMAYADQGEGQPILLVHGWAAHGGFFADLQNRLARSWRGITPTLRGHLGSARGTRALTVETLGEDIAALVETLKLPRVTALGWSMGAMALWAAAPRLGQRLRALIVEEMSPRIVNDDPWNFGLAGGYAPRNVEATLSEIHADWPAYVQRLAPRMFSNSTCEQHPDLVRWTATEMAKADPAAMADFWRSMAAQDFRAALSAINIPVLAVRGGDSQIYPAGANAVVAETSPLGASITLNGAGHVPHLESPDSFFEQIGEFLRRTNQQEVLREGVNP